MCLDLIMCLSSQKMMTECPSAEEWLLFVWELSPLGILQVDATKIFPCAVVDQIVCAEPRGRLFHIIVFASSDSPGGCVRSLRWQHGNRVTPRWEMHPFSLGEMPWLLSDFVLQLSALSSCRDCLCNDDKELWVIRAGLRRCFFNLLYYECCSAMLIHRIQLWSA